MQKKESAFSLLRNEFSFHFIESRYPFNEKIEKSYLLIKVVDVSN